MIDVVIEDGRWDASGLDTLARRAIKATWTALALEGAVEVVVLGCDDARIAALNADFRDKPMPTNVLSWPETDLAPARDGAAPHPPQPDPTGSISLGDIALSYDTCAREAENQNKPFEDHVTHLIVHGTLHLLGYDHVRDLDATRMEAEEIKILGILGVPDPY